MITAHAHGSHRDTCVQCPATTPLDSTETVSRRPQRHPALPPKRYAVVANPTPIDTFRALDARRYHARMTHFGRFFVHFALVFGGFLACTDAARAQDRPTPQQYGQAALQLGARAAAHQRVWPAADTVVVARSNRAFLEAVAAWDRDRRYPVLIDDGSADAAWRIARFVHAYAPNTVFFVGDEADDDEPPSTRQRIADVVEGQRHRSLRTPGVVFAHEDDPAWPAAVLLAAGRNQHIAWLGAPGRGVSTRMNTEALDAVRGSIADQLDAADLEWSGIGDDIDAVTLCTNTASVVGRGDDSRAITDLIGRSAAGVRWAWAGQVHGDESASAYRAACALFLQPSRAWIFDGYPADFAPPYRAAAATTHLEAAGIEIVANVRPPAADVSAWRVASRGGVEADLVLVNTKGNPRWFDLTRGRARAWDVPVLALPAAVHFIHSFSAHRPGEPATIAGMWFERGAFAYVGSVHEPFLGAFLPHANVAERLVAGMPWGAAGRHLGGRFGRAWKVNVFGDPLYGVASPRRVALGGEVPVADARDGGGVLAGAAGAGRSVESARLLVMLGRWGDGLELARAMLDDGETNVGDDVVRVMMPAAVLEERADVAAELFDRAGAGLRRDGVFISMVWAVLRHELAADTGRYLGILMTHPREGSLVEDAAALRPHVGRVFGRDAVVRMYERFAAEAGSERERERVLESAPVR